MGPEEQARSGLEGAEIGQDRDIGGSAADPEGQPGLGLQESPLDLGRVGTNRVSQDNDICPSWRSGRDRSPFATPEGELA
jgi:hypothetical protein